MYVEATCFSEANLKQNTFKLQIDLWKMNIEFNLNPTKTKNVLLTIFNYIISFLLSIKIPACFDNTSKTDLI